MTDKRNNKAINKSTNAQFPINLEDYGPSSVNEGNKISLNLKSRLYASPILQPIVFQQQQQQQQQGNGNGNNNSIVNQHKRSTANGASATSNSSAPNPQLPDLKKLKKNHIISFKFIRAYFSS